MAAATVRAVIVATAAKATVVTATVVMVAATAIAAKGRVMTPSARPRPGRRRRRPGLGRALGVMTRPLAAIAVAATMTTVAVTTVALAAVATITARTVAAAISGAVAPRRGRFRSSLDLTLVGLGRPHRGDEGLRQRAQASQGGMVVGECGDQRRLGLQSARGLTPGDQVADQLDGLFEALQVILWQRFDSADAEVAQPPFQEWRGQTATRAGKDVEDGAGPALGGRVGHGAGSVERFPRYQPEMTRRRYRPARASA